MKFNRHIAAFVAICITAILVIAVCGCDDLGAYSDTEEYYNSFYDVVFIGGAAGTGKGYPIEDVLYNKESRENFLTDENGGYHGVEHSNYVYVAIPFARDIDMDSLAMYVQAKNDVELHINVYIAEDIPENWQGIETLDVSAEETVAVTEETSNEILEEKTTETSTDLSVETSAETSEESATESTAVTEGEEETYDDPDPEASIGQIVLHLKGGKWDSFTLNSFKINGNIEKSIYVEGGQYILLQITNNCAAFDVQNGIYKDSQGGLVLDKAEITITNLLLRALETENTADAKED